MQKEKGWGAEYPDETRNGEWEYAAFKPDGSRIERDYKPCFECHKPIEDLDYVFSLEELVAAAKGE